MNRMFRLVLSRAVGQWVPVSEATRGAAKGRRQLRCAAMRRRIAALAVLTASLDYSGLATAAPSGAQVTAGSGTVSQTGNTTIIRQTSADLFLNWQSFNVAANEVVDFIQPSVTSIAVNRILGNTGSQIFGHLDANGQVWLINPNGILFGAGAQVNVGGLTASTLDVSDASFGASLRSFSGSGTGSVVNQGVIQAANGGYVALLGNQVSNQGVIRAQLGTVALGAGSAATLTFSGRQLLHLRVDQSTLNDLAANGQLIQADGGRVIMTAGAQNSLLASVVNNTGIVQARSVENHDGSITLVAGMAAGRVNVGGTLDATAPAGGSGGSIETSGAAVSVASSAKVVAGPGGTWRIDPIDLTIDTAAATTIDNSLNTGTSVTEVTTATTASSPGVQTTGPGNINVAAPIAWTNAAATLTLTAYNAINVNASVNGAGKVVMQAGTGNLTIATGASIVGDAGVTLGTGANFVNQSGANAVSAGLTATWLVYSTNPTLDTPGGLTPAFIQYGAAFQATPAQAGNGLLYSVAPSITITALAGSVSKTYDGGTGASLTAANSNYTVSGTLNGDTVNSMGATYQSADVGSAIPVTSPSAPAGLGITNASGIPVYGYGLAGTPVTASIGMISAAQLSAAIVADPVHASFNLSKVYDGTTTATLDSGNYLISGFVTGQSASVNQPSSIAYALAGAGPETLNATFAATNFVAGNGTKLSNYILPTTATGSGSVQQAPLVITGVLATGKVYTATTSDTLNTTNAGLYGMIGGDVVSLSTTGATGTFSSANVGNNLSVSTSGFSLSGAQQADYQLIAPASLSASITPAPLSITGVSAANKIYDGNTTATLIYNNPQLSGFLGGDATTVLLSYSTAAGAFPSKNVGVALPVTTTGFSISGTNASNYDLTQATGLTANITPAQLTVALIGNPTKPYNGTTTAALSSANFTVNGFVSGEGATIPQTALAEYASVNASVQTVTATLVGADFATTGGALLSNYSVPATVTGTGTITRAPLTGMITGNPTKVYDSTASATLTGANYVLTGFLTGEGVTVNQTSGLYASPNAGPEQVTATLSTGNYTATGGTLLSNYSLPTTMTGTGTITPAPLTCTNTCLYAAITGNPTKPYDGTTTATLAPGNFLLTGLLNSDSVTVTQTVGQYGSANAGVQNVSVVLTAPDFTANGATILSNYTLPTSAYGSGTIMPVALSVTVIGNPTRVYNGSTSTVLASSNYSIAGFVPGESAQINPSALINYASADVGTQSITAALTPSAYTPVGSTLLSNYVLASSAAGNGQITPASVYVTGVYATNKVYDTQSADPLNKGSMALSGVVSSDTANVSVLGTPAGAFATTQVGLALPVSVSGLSITGSAASNYTLQPITGLAANITPAPLTITGVSASSKPYDGTAIATLNTASEALAGLYVGDTVTLSAAAAVSAFTSVNVGSNLKVTASGFVINGAQASDYTVTQPTGLSADITQAPITAVITGNPTKVYDGTASTTLTNANYTLIGFATVGSVTQGAAVPQSATASFTAPDAGTGVAIGSTLVLSDFVANAGTNLSNYALPTTGAGTGTITQAPLAIALVGNPTKSYDGTVAATLSPANYTLSGFVGSQSATVTQVNGAYASANAGSEAVTAALTPATYSPVLGTNLSNYALPATVTGTGTITRAPLTVINVATTPQTYNGTATDALTGATLSGTAYNGDQLVLTNVTSGTLGSSGNAGTDTVTTSFGLSCTCVGGVGSGNYTVLQPTGLTALISPVLLSATSSVTKTYDGTTSAILSGGNTTFVGFIGTQGATVNSGVTGAFATANVGVGIAVAGVALTTSNVTATGSTLLSNYTLPATDDGFGSITAATLTYTATPSSQQYGLTPTGLTGSVSGFVNGESALSGTAVFTTLATGANSVGRYLITGSGVTASSNYIFAQAAGNATALTITRAPLTVSGVQTTSRAYDGTTIDALSGAVISGTTYNGDVLALTSATTGTLGSNGNVGSDAVTTNMGLSGAASPNYILTQESGLTANISSLALSAVASVTRSYNGTLIASLSGANTVFTGFLPGQGATVNAGVTGTFATANVGTGLLVTGGALSAGNLTGTGSTVLSNYALPTSDSGSGTITPAIINLTGTRVYDGLLDANAVIFGTAGTLATGVGAETLILSGSGTLANKNVVTSGVMASINGLTLGNGTGFASNYQLTSGTDTVTVTPLAITVNATGINKVYNGNVTAAVTLASSGVLTSSGDSLSFADTSATFANKNAANGAAVSVSGITESGTGSGNYTVNATAATTANITPLAITVTATGINKVYNGNVTAGVTLASSGVLTSSGDNVSFADTSATFANKNVANGAAVSVSGITESGLGAGNYTANVTATTSANITPAIVNLSGTRVYDGLLDANASIFAAAGMVNGVNGETLMLSGSGTLTTKNVIANGVLSSSSGLSLANGTGLASNYQLSGGADTVTVTPLTITVAATGINKAYDGGLAAGVTLTGTGVLFGDSLSYADTSATFANKNVANGLAVSVSGITASGTGSGNYNVNATAATSANITPAIVNLSGTRVYDGLLDANAGIFGAAGTVNGVSGETLSLSGSGVLTTKNVITNGALSSSSGLALGNGTGLASNYQLSGGTDTVTVTPLPITVTGTANNKIYDGTTIATLSGLGSGGVIAGDTVNFADTSATFNTKNVTTATTVTIVGITGGGADAGNYALNNTTTTASADITPLPITVTATANNKTYDGTTTATLSRLGSAGVIAGDTVAFTDAGATFAGKNVSNGQTVTIYGISDAGADAGNYRFNASAVTTADITPATLTETAIPVTVAAGQVPKLGGSVSGFVPGDTLANATDGTLVWSTDATVPEVPGSYAIDGSGLTAENYVLLQSPANAAALTITAAPETTAGGVVGAYLAAADIATPYGVGSANDYGNNTGNARRDADPTDGNRHLSDFTGRLALTVIGAGVKLPAQGVP